ncbi:MAG: Transposase domain group 1 [Sphaerisporangium sp.]|nr:Transposase domain group 1 [Sphaerisporangium sp.]
MMPLSWALGQRPATGQDRPAVAGRSGRAHAAAARRDVLTFLDVDSMQRRTYGYAKQGSGFGNTKISGKSLLVRGLNVLAATVSTPLAAPLICGTRLRGGKANSARGAASFVRESITTARQTGAGGTLVLRGDPAFYSADVIGACRERDARFSVTAKMDPKIKAAIAGIDETGWTPITYPNAVFDDQAGGWISDAEIAEVDYTAFTSKKGQAVTARLIVRRVRRLNEQARRGQDELFAAHRYHAIFTDSPYALVQAEEQHRDHAMMEQVNADLIDGPLAHLPSGKFTANAAWLTCAAITHDLLRAFGCLAGAFHARGWPDTAAATWSCICHSIGAGSRRGATPSTPSTTRHPLTWPDPPQPPWSPPPTRRP